MPKQLTSTRVFLASLGCARNQIDSEVMLGRLQRSGATVVGDPAQAEAIVVNTCSFIEAATDESIDTILALAEYGMTRALLVIGAAVLINGFIESVLEPTYTGAKLKLSSGPSTRRPEAFMASRWRPRAMKVVS